MSLEEAIQAQAVSPRKIMMDVYTTWCGPCKVIAPYYEELSKQFTDVVFIKVRMEGRRRGRKGWMEAMRI